MRPTEIIPTKRKRISTKDELEEVIDLFQLKFPKKTFRDIFHPNSYDTFTIIIDLRESFHVLLLSIGDIQVQLIIHFDFPTQ